MARFFAFTIGLAMIGAMLVFIVVGFYSVRFGKCIWLPSGVNLGYEAIIDLRNPFLRPDAALKTTDGTILASEIWPIYTTERATFGTAWSEEHQHRHFEFIWQADQGFARKDQNPEVFARYSENLGGTFFGATREMNVNTLWLLKRLQAGSQFENRACKTRLLTW